MNVEAEGRGREKAGSIMVEGRCPERVPKGRFVSKEVVLLGMVIG